MAPSIVRENTVAIVVWVLWISAVVCFSAWLFFALQPGDTGEPTTGHPTSWCVN